MARGVPFAVRLDVHRYRRHRRIVFTYDMWVDGRHLSTSLTTITLAPDGDGTLLTYTEQGAHFDAMDTFEGREEGSRGLLDQLGMFLASDR